MKTLFILSLLTVLALSANAAPGPGRRDPGVNWRQRNQQERIADGVRSGELTRREAWTLERKEAHLALLERRLKSDGTLTVAERARLQAELNDLSKDIYRQKHDAQTR